MFLLRSMVLLMVLPHLVIAMIATQQTVKQRSSGLFRWFPQAKDTGQIPLSYYVLHSPAIDFAPWLELHHIVLLGAPGSSKVFAIDYSPLNQKASLMKLFRGISVPAEIRVRMIDANTVSDIQDIKRKWTCMGTDTGTYNDENVDGKVVTMDDLTMMAKNDENLRVVRDVIDRIYRKWSCSMNLYTHNCQHFSHFVGDLLTKERVCSVDVEEEVTPTQMDASVISLTMTESVSS